MKSAIPGWFMISLSWVVGLNSNQHIFWININLLINRFLPHHHVSNWLCGSQDMYNLKCFRLGMSHNLYVWFILPGPYQISSLFWNSAWKFQPHMISFSEFPYTLYLTHVMNRIFFPVELFVFWTLNFLREGSCQIYLCILQST